MLHVQVREARKQHGLSQSELARRADIPRTTLRDFEDGSNITLETLRKILAQLPGLRSVSLGAVEMHSGAVDPTAARQTLIDLITAAGRALALFDAPPAPPPPTATSPVQPAGATRHEPGSESSAQLEQRVLELEKQLLERNEAPRNLTSDQ